MPHTPEPATGLCPHCGTVTLQECVFTHDFLQRTYDATYGYETEADLGCTYFVATCGACSDLLVYYEPGYEDPVDTFTERTLVYPTSARLSECVPTRVRQIYDEAYLIRRLSPSGFAVLIRRALEAVANDRGVLGGGLHSQLRRLASRGEIPPVLAEMGQVVRLLGNNGAHDSHEEITALHTRILDEMFRAIIQYVYVLPCRMDDIKDMLRTIRSTSTGSDLG